MRNMGNLFFVVVWNASKSTLHFSGFAPVGPLTDDLKLPEGATFEYLTYEGLISA